MFGTKENLEIWCNAHLIKNDLGYVCPISGDVVVPAKNRDNLWVILGWSEDVLSDIEDKNLEHYKHQA